MTALAKIEPKTLAVVEDDGPSKEQIEQLRKNFCKTANDQELIYFSRVCTRLRLDPFARQVFLVKRGADATTQVSIDGFRLVAERTGEYEGQTPHQWCGPDGVWKDVWPKGEPVAARVGVYRKGFREPLYAVARWDSYAQNTPIWKKMPDLMLAKCAESLALRRAFPQDLSGVYTTDEMAQAGNDDHGESLPHAVNAAIGAGLASEAQDRAAKSEAQQVQKNRDSDQADVWIEMIKTFSDAHEIERWCHYNGYAYSNMHANAKGRISTALRHAALRASVQENLIKEMLAHAPKPIDECDEDGVVNGEVMEGEAAQ